jgi:HEAT repeat protein
MDLKTLQELPPWDWPTGTGKALLDVLRDPAAGAADRLAAAELAGEFTVINDALVKALLSIVSSGDESEALRGRAALSLGPALEYAYTNEDEESEDDQVISDATYREIKQALHDLYGDATIPKDVRRDILEASVRAPQEWHREAIQKAHARDDEDWKLTAVFGMRFMRGFDEQILEALNSRNPDIRHEALCAAGNWGLERAWPHVIALINSESTDKRFLLAAIEAAAAIRPDEACEILADFADDDDEDVAEAARDALALASAAVDDDDDDFDDESF